MEKRPIDRIRNSSGHADVGTSEEGAIEDMENINGRLIIVKKRAVYEVRMADEIDPDRKFAHLPPTSQKLLINLGTESEILSKTYLTVKRLVKSSYLPSNIDVVKVLSLSLELAVELNVLDKEIAEYIAIEDKATAVYEERKIKKLDHFVPSIPDIATRCKTVFQKADQAYQAQLAIIRIFYPEFSEQSHYSAFVNYIKEKYDEQDFFFLFLQEVLQYILLARNIRNCLDHRRNETRIMDFELQSDGEIFSPTIEVNYNGSIIPRMSLSQFLPSLLLNLTQIFETLIVCMVIKNLNPNRTFPVQVRLIPEEKRINKFIEYAYWLPIGPEGFYQQK